MPSHSASLTASLIGEPIRLWFSLQRVRARCGLLRARRDEKACSAPTRHLGAKNETGGER